MDELIYRLIYQQMQCVNPLILIDDPKKDELEEIKNTFLKEVERSQRTSTPNSQRLLDLVEKALCICSNYNLKTQLEIIKDELSGCVNREAAKLQRSLTTSGLKTSENNAKISVEIRDSPDVILQSNVKPSAQEQIAATLPSFTRSYMPFDASQLKTLTPESNTGYNQAKEPVQQSQSVKQEEEKQDINKYIFKLELELKEADENNKVLKEGQERLLGQLKEKNALIERLNEGSVACEDVEKLEEELREKEETIHQLNEELKTKPLQGQLDENEITLFKNEIEQLKLENEEETEEMKNQTLNLVNEIHEEYEKKITKLETEKLETKNQLQEILGDNKKLVLRVKQLEDEVKLANQEIVQFKVEQQDQHEHMDESIALKENEINRLKQENNDLMLQVEEFQAEAEEMEWEKQEDVSTARYELQELETKNNQLVLDGERLAAQLDELEEEKRAEVEELNKLNEHLEKEFDELEGQNTRLNSQLQGNKTLNKEELEELQNRNNQLGLENENLLSQFEQLRDENERLQLEIAALKTKINDDRLEMTNSEIENNQHQLELLEENNEMSQELQVYQSKVKQMEKVMQQVNQQNYQSIMSSATRKSRCNQDEEEDDDDEFTVNDLQMTLNQLEESNIDQFMEKVTQLTMDFDFEKPIQGTVCHFMTANSDALNGLILQTDGDVKEQAKGTISTLFDQQYSGFRSFCEQLGVPYCESKEFAECFKSYVLMYSFDEFWHLFKQFIDGLELEMDEGSSLSIGGIEISTFGACLLFYLKVYLSEVDI